MTVLSSRPSELASFYARVLGTPLDGGVDHLTGEAMFRTQLDGLEFEVIGSSSLSGGSSVQPSVQVPDVAAAVQRALEADGSVQLGAATHDWGTYAIVLDPDGNRLGLFSAPTPTSMTEGTA
ncbi:MAG: Glyoxalase-like domain [Thermoleophilia bacterium]|nr:Glyoxalase-like domain [Thermoleophilia bacterium]